ncbi:MAG: hypothetical protein ABSB84_07895 [Verrucomicrobiota bacterium]|jgi:uncharacterized membrane protein
MNNLREVIDKVTSGNAPVWVMGGAGIILFLLALKTAKGFLKFVFVVLALAALAGAGWWYFHKQGRI